MSASFPDLRKDKKNQALEGVRAVAVLLVLCVHAGTPGFAIGWIGVDIFFVLSGFLITTLLLKEHDRSGTINLRAFWIRRFLRLMPAYLTYISVITLLVLIAPAGTIRASDGWTPATYLLSLWTYTINYVPKGGIWDLQHLTIHLWSLAVEEQFYFLFPPVLLAGYALFRSPLVTICLLFAVFLGLTLWGVLPGRANSVLETRGMAIILGCFMAAAYDKRFPLFEPIRASARFYQAVTWLCVAGLIGMSALTYAGGFDQDLLLRTWTPPYLVCVGFLICGYWYGFNPHGQKILTRRFMVYTGKMSYGLYLYHLWAWFIVWHLLDADLFDVLGRYGAYAIRMTIYLGLSYAFAALSFRWIETPFLNLKDRRFGHP